MSSVFNTGVPTFDTSISVPGQYLGPGAFTQTLSPAGQLFGPRTFDTTIRMFPTSVSVPGVLYGPRTQTANSFGSFLPFLPAGVNNDFAPRTPAEIKDTVVAAGAALSTTYGRARLLGELYTFMRDTLFLGIYVFGRGEFEAFEKLSIDGREVDVSARGSAEFTDSALTGPNGYCQLFLGTAGQDVSAATASGRTAQWISETLANTVCVVIQIDGRDHEINGRFPRVEAIVQGRNDIFDPRDSSTGYSANPALCFNHFVTTYLDSSTSGDATTLGDVADRCDGIGAGNTLTGSVKRHTWGMQIGQQNADIERMTAMLESAAKLYATEEDGTWLYVVSGPKTYAHTIDDDVIRFGSVELRGADPREYVTDVRVKFSDIENNVVGTAEAVGGTSGRVSTVRMPWITTHAEAKRAAVERYRHLRQESELLVCDVKGDGLKVLRGEVVRFTIAAFGISAQDFTVTKITMAQAGYWRLYCRQYRSETWSDSVTTDPISSVGAPDDDALNPPTLASLAGTSTATGRQARIDLTWDDPEYPYFREVRVDVFDADEDPDVLLGTYFTRERDGTSISGLPAGVNFAVEASVLSSAGVQGTAATAAVAKPVLPTPPAVTSAHLRVVGPRRIGEADGVRLRVKWDDVDFTAWVGYRLKVWSDESTADLASVTDREPDDVVEFPQGGVGAFSLPAPAPNSDVFGTPTYYRFALYAYNANGDESAAFDLQAQDNDGTSGQSDYHELQQLEEFQTAATTGNSTWHDYGDDGDGNHIVGFALGSGFGSDPIAAIGCWVTVYTCNSGGTISGVLKQVFISAAQIAAQASGETYAAGFEYGMMTFPNGGGSPHVSLANLHCRLTVPDTPGARYYRYTLLWVGCGDQQDTQEYDIYEDSDGSGSANPTGTLVHGAI